MQFILLDHIFLTPLNSCQYLDYPLMSLTQCIRFVYVFLKMFHSHLSVKSMSCTEYLCGRQSESNNTHISRRKILTHCCPHIETSQLICKANQLTGFYMRATLAFNGLMLAPDSSRLKYSSKALLHLLASILSWTMIT